MKNILFIIDPQNDFCHPDGKLNCENSETAVKNICELLKNNKFDSVIISYDIHDSDYIETIEGQHLPVEHCLDNEWGSYIHKDIYDATYPFEGHSWRVDKHSFMMDEPEIEYIFNNERNITDYVDDCRIYICGFATDICVLNNALMLKHYFANAYEIYLLENCCAGTTKEMHDKAVDIMKVNHINVVDNPVISQW